MSLRFCSFSSGSSGNCYLIRSDTSAVLVDAGISGKRIMEGLAETETDPSMLKGIVITHEHSDHEWAGSARRKIRTEQLCEDLPIYLETGGRNSASDNGA